MRVRKLHRVQSLVGVQQATNVALATNSHQTMFVKRAQHRPIDVDALAVKPSGETYAAQGKVVANVGVAAHLGAECMPFKMTVIVLRDSEIKQSNKEM
jgi:hypothetical protein